MPIYEYKCQACEHEFERLQKISDAALTDCPECLRASLVKKISAAGFRLSGGGWYETDFKKGGKQKNLAGDRDTAAKGGESNAGSAGKSDAGKADKPPAKAAATQD